MKIKMRQFAVLLLLAGVFAASVPAADSAPLAAEALLPMPQQGDIVHDAEYYIIEAQNRQAWAAEDTALDQRLAELRAEHGTPPNIIHVMWDDTSFGDVGIPAINKIGIESVGVFEDAEKADSPVYVLLAHKSMRTFLTLTQQLLADETFMSKGADFLNAPAESS